MLEQAYSILFLTVLIGLAVAAFLAMVRSFVAKNMIIRFIGVNILTTVIVIAISLLAVLFKEAYLPDVAIVFALLGCIAIMILCKIYINLFEKNQGGKK